MNDDFVLYCLYWQIIVKLQPNLYSEDTCLSPEGVPWREVPCTVYKRSGTTRVSYFPKVSRSGPVWWSFWVERLLRVWLVSRSFPLLFTVLLSLPTAQALYITAGSLVALYNGQCNVITKMISDRRWQRGLLQLWARFLSFPSVSILGGSLETFKKIKGRFQSTLSKWWIKELHCSYIP